MVRLPNEDEEIAVREVLMHMIEEYARHNGHADLIRELVDGSVGC
jgi:ribosomal protein S3AE